MNIINIFNKYRYDFEHKQKEFFNVINTLNFKELIFGIKYIENYYLKEIDNINKTCFYFLRKDIILELCKFNNKYRFCTILSYEFSTKKIFPHIQSKYKLYDKTCILNILISQNKMFYVTKYYDYNKKIWNILKSDIYKISYIYSNIVKDKIKLFYYYLPEIIISLN
jgi:hypothetical protein